MEDIWISLEKKKVKTKTVHVALTLIPTYK